MAGSNLPPGVTPADIDKHFGEPELHIEHCEATVDVALTEDVDPTGLLSVTAPDWEVVHVEDIEESAGELVKAVYIGFSIETQYRDSDDIRRDARKQFSVTADDERVSHVDHIDTELV